MSDFKEKAKNIGREIFLFLSSKIFLKNLAGMIALIAGVLALSFFWMSSYTHHGESLQVPSFLNMTITSGIRPVVIPYLANKKRSGEDVGAAYLHASQLLSCIVVPIIAVLSYASLSIIIFMFGDQWHASASILSILGIAYMTRILHSLSPQLLVASGAEKVMFLKDAFLLGLTVALVFVFYPYGLNFVAYAAVCAALANFLILTVILKLKLNITISSQLKSIVPNALLSVLCLGWTIVFDHFIIPLNASAPALEILTLGATTSVVWIGSIFIIRHPLRMEIIGLFRKILKTSKG